MRDIYCAVTDNDWFDFLRVRPHLSEVNFWKPTPQTFRAIEEGGIFAFKLKAPRNKIGGFGILTTSADAPLHLAWDAFGEGNGFSSLSEFVGKITSIRRSANVNEYSLIGVRVLVHQVFFPETLWFDPPRDWVDNIVTGKTYARGTIAAEQLFQELETRSGGLADPVAPRSAAPGLAEDTPAGWGAPIPVRPRIGQGTFRINVGRAYENTCAVSGTKVLPALDAAHIRSFASEPDHSVQNGIMLRRDIHSVFDAGFATIDAKGRFVVSELVKSVFNNGSEYRRLHGVQIKKTADPKWAPSEEALEWHRNERFERSRG